MGLSGQYRIIDIDEERDNRGVLSHPDVPFVIKSIFWLSDVPERAIRGCHAHHRLNQFIIVLNGSVNITLKVPDEQVTFHIDNCRKGLYVGAFTWIELSDFSPDAVIMVLASEPYDERDYINDFSTFCSLYKTN